MTELKREPAMPLYCADWLTGEATTSIKPEVEGAFIRLLCYAWIASPECTIPDDDEVLAHVSRLGAKWKKIGGPVKALFEVVPEHPGRLRNAKQWKVWNDRLEFRRKQKNKGHQRQSQTRAERQPEASRTSAGSQPIASSSVSGVTTTLSHAREPMTFDEERALQQAQSKGVDWTAVERIDALLVAGEIHAGMQTIVAWLADCGEDLIAETFDDRPDARAKKATYFEKILYSRKANPHERPGQRRAATGTDRRRTEGSHGGGASTRRNPFADRQPDIGAGEKDDTDAA